MSNVQKLAIIDIDGSTHTVVKSGLLFAYGDPAFGGLPLTLLFDAAKIPDYGRNLKRPATIMARVQSAGYIHETRFDVVHGRRYMIGCYRARGIALRPEQERRIVLAAMDGIANLRQYQIDCGISASELDAMAAKELAR